MGSEMCIRDRFEEVAYLILNKDLPNTIQLKKFEKEERINRDLSKVLYSIIKIMPKKSNSLVSQLDLFSSLAKLTGSDLRADDSIDLMDTFMGKSDEGRSELILEATTRTAFRSGDWVMIPPYNGPAKLKAVNIEIANSQKYQLYNLSNDISQKVNLAESEPEKLQEMNSRFTEIRGEEYNKRKKLEKELEETNNGISGDFTDETVDRYSY